MNEGYYEDENKPEVEYTNGMRDNGQRMEFSTGAIREPHEGKGRYDLIPQVGVDRLAKWYERGAKKYSRDIEFNNIEGLFEWLKLNVQSVKNIKVNIVEECAETVMKNGLEKTIMNLLIDNEKTQNYGIENILKQEINIVLDEELTQSYEIEINKINEETTSKILDYQKVNIKDYSNYKKINVQSVNEISQKLELCILTMTIKQDLLEEYYVVGATTELGCLKTVLKFLKMLLNTSNNLPQQIYYDNKYIMSFSGNRNWEKGLPTSNCMNSLLRHAFKASEGWDDEDHLAAILWNAMAIMYMQKFKPELDDIPKKRGYIE